MDLFGKKRYQERIAELERMLQDLTREREELEHALQKREERLKRITSAYQEARRALKEAELRLREASERPSKAHPSEEHSEAPGVERLSPRAMKRLLRRLDDIESAEEVILSEYRKPGGNLESMPEAILPRSLKALASERGISLLSLQDVFTLVIVPPLPFGSESMTRGRRFDLAPIQEIMETPVLLVSAHAGESMIMVSLGADHIETFEIVKTPVKEKHSKGGWSQRRFERLREEDIRRHGEHLRERVEKAAERYAPLVRCVTVSGEPELISCLNQCFSLPVIRARLGRHDERNPERTLEELYTYTLFRM
ncbi:MAG: Vms1/Ankzf1 family peptidyl-tRNA hydrolase [Methanothrix sp.]|uniref:Vms1/Ankzf1 family peptidyl-tRNA hydrolase n=1 Tax=Methanothrix sp. TaxID=90426 RepID=UPI00247D36FD|nr:Vms1/Ankzf1 family peptidyl-tRNA hydrolase [Methanothrix sp.]